MQLRGLAVVRDICDDLKMLCTLAPRVLAMIGRELGWIFFVGYGVVVLLLTVAPLLQSYWLGDLVDRLIKRDDNPVGEATVLGAWILVMVALQSFVGKLQGFLGDWMRRLLWYRASMFGAISIASLELEDYRDQQMRETITRVREHARWRFSTFADNQALFVLNVLALGVAIWWLWELNWLLVCIVAACIPELLVELGASRASRRLERREGEKWRAFWYENWELVNDKSIIEHQVAGTVGQYAWRAGWYGEKLRDGENRLRFAIHGWRIAALTLAFSVLAYSAWTVIALAISGEVQPGKLTFFVGGLIGIAGTITRIALNLHELARDGHVIGDLFEVYDKARSKIGTSVSFDLASSTDLHPQGFGNEEFVERAFERAPEIAFDKVAFQHRKIEKSSGDGIEPSGTESEFQFRNLSLTIRSGEKLVIVGDSGAGKTTFAELVSHVRKPTSGTITAENKPLQFIDRRAWWSTLGVLLQRFEHPAPFTIREVLALGSGRPYDSLRDEEIWRALARARADGFIKKKKRGLDTLLGKEFLDGSDLSAGEWQRLRLATLFLRDPLVWILDEPTSALDPINASKIMEELFQLKGRTLILITHWLRNCPKADRIIVFEKGEISEQGTHEQLMAKDKIYAKLYRSQMGEVSNPGDVESAAA